MNRIDPRETAIGERGAPYLLSIDTSWTEQRDSKHAIDWTRDFWAQMRPFSRGGAYLNFLGQGEEGEALLRASYGEANYYRLVELKKKYDPSNQFRMNQNIVPS